MGVNDKERQTIYNIYYKYQLAIVDCNAAQDEVKTSQEIRQGWVLSSLLFMIYTQKAINEFKQTRNKIISIYSEIINTIRYADDIVLLVETEKQ